MIYWLFMILLHWNIDNFLLKTKQIVLNEVFFKIVGSLGIFGKIMCDRLLKEIENKNNVIHIQKLLDVLGK